MLTLKQIKQQTLPHVISLATDRWGRYVSDRAVMDAHEWVSKVIYDYHRVYEPFTEITRKDVDHFLQLWADYYVNDDAPAEPHDSWGAPLEKIS